MYYILFFNYSTFFIPLQKENQYFLPELSGKNLAFILIVPSDIFNVHALKGMLKGLKQFNSLWPLCL